jgi:hypothetical protein
VSMTSVVGIDSRIFVRRVRKPDGNYGEFHSVLGVAVKVRDYEYYDKAYAAAMSKAFEKICKQQDYRYYCVNDIHQESWKDALLNEFVKQITSHIEKIHVFYTLFSRDRVEKVKVYGRKSKREKIKLSSPERTYDELINEHTLHVFPIICAWRLSDFLTPRSSEFHFDYYSGHIFEAYEVLDKKGFHRLVYPGGDCCNPVISTADLLLDVIDTRLKIQKKRLLFENIRPVLAEFGEKVLAYPITTKHLSFITPLDDVPVPTVEFIKHPVFWVFKGSELIDPGTLKRSPAFRSLIDWASNKNGVVKLFEKGRDIGFFKEGDYGVYLNPAGEQIIDSYRQMGKRFEKFKFELMVPSSNKKLQDFP